VMISSPSTTRYNMLLCTAVLLAAYKVLQNTGTVLFTCTDAAKAVRRGATRQGAVRRGAGLDLSCACNAPHRRSTPCIGSSTLHETLRTRGRRGGRHDLCAA
jgi:hypothetical protein